MPAVKRLKTLTHLDARGAARMVDVSEKQVTRRTAVAAADITMSIVAWRAIRAGRVAKGDVGAVARVAGIAAVKRTAELIPLCHPLPVDGVTVDVDISRSRRVRVSATVTVAGRTGVEMEALTAVSVAALAVYDMCKALDRGITIGPIRLLEKSGGRSGHWKRGGYGASRRRKRS